MRRVYFETRDRHTFITKRNLDDLMDLSESWKTRYGRKLVSWKKFFGVASEKNGKDRAKRIMGRMFSLMADDLIEGHDCFILPRKRTGFFKIDDLAKYEQKSTHKGNIVTGIRVHGGVVILHKDVLSSNGGRAYFFKMVRPLSARLYRRTMEGYTWD